MDNSTTIKSAFIPGLIVGVLDGTAACINAYILRGMTPAGVFKYVASGALGKSASDGDWKVVALGLLFHFFIALEWTLIFFVLYNKVGFLRRDKYVVGPLFGLFIWVVMNALVLPISQVAPVTYKLVPTLSQIGIHMFVIGLSIALFANRALTKVK